MVELMSFLKKIKEKILNLSNSHIFYKTQYNLLSNQVKNQEYQIEFLENEFCKIFDEFDKINNSISNQNDVSKMEIEGINSKLDNIVFFNDNFESKWDLFDDSFNSLGDEYKDSLMNIKSLIIKNRVIMGSINDEGVSRIVDLINSNGADVGSKYDEGVSRIVDLINTDNTNLKRQIAVVNNNLLKYGSNSDSNLAKLVNAYEEHYKEIRKYFFNGYESTLKQVMDTDFLFNVCYYNNINFLSYSPKENRILLETEDGIILGTNNHIWTIMEINGLNEYIIPQLYSFDDFVVFDIGMNRAYASLKFANFDNCSKVYGFEIDEFTYERAIDNINFNPSLSDKIKPYNFGLSDKDEVVELYCVDGYDGLNTMISKFTEIQPSLRSLKDNLKVKSAYVKKTTDILSEIIESDNIDSHIVLKIDTEGAEYKIINDLIESGLIKEMDVILGEGHVFSDEDFRDKLTDLGFCDVKLDMESFTYSFAYVKKEYYNFWPNIPLYNLATGK